LWKVKDLNIICWEKLMSVLKKNFKKAIKLPFRVLIRKACEKDRQ
jgi:hypothetical protein